MAVLTEFLSQECTQIAKISNQVTWLNRQLFNVFYYLLVNFRWIQSDIPTKQCALLHTHVNKTVTKG